MNRRGRRFYIFKLDRAGLTARFFNGHKIFDLIFMV